MANNKRRPVAWESLCAPGAYANTIVEYSANRDIFRQGQPAHSLFCLREGKVKLAVISRQGREAILAIFGSGELFGEGCLAGQPLRTATATAMTNCAVVRIGKRVMMRLLHDRHEVSEWFLAHLLSRNVRYEADLVDQMFDSSEKRLARVLLLLSHFGQEGRAESVIPRVSQASLAQTVGTTRSRVRPCMNKFRTLGFIDYAGGGGLTVHSGLLNVVLRD